MRNRFPSFHGVTERWRMPLCILAIMLAMVDAFSQAPPSIDKPDHNTAPKSQLDDEAAQAWAWLAKWQLERGQFKNVAEGRYFINANTDLEKSENPSECNDVWTLRKSGNGEFEVDGDFTEYNGNSEEDSFHYQIKLNPQMQPTAFKKQFAEGVSGCMWTKSKFLCQETDRKGHILGAAGAPIDNSTKFLPHFFSPFLFNGFIPNSKTQSGEISYLTLLILVYFDEPGYSIDLYPRYGALSLIRRGTYSIPGAQIYASEFQLDVREVPNATITSPGVPMIPPDSEHKDQYKPLWRFLVSSNGILLSATDANTHEEFIRLVQFKKLADF